MADAAQQVRAQLSGDYPPSALKWIDDLSWRGPVQVPLSRVDFSDADPDWAPAKANRAKIASFAARIRKGDRKPVTLVRTPGNPKMRCVDGHNRCLAYLSLAAPVTAWVGTATSEHGDWEDLHSQQVDMADGDGLTVDLSAQTAALEVTPAPYGKPGGPGLYHVRGLSHSDYFEHIVQAMMRKGRTKAQASAMAWGILRRWARGGGSVHPEVRAAAAAALAQEAAKAATAHAHANHGPAVELAGVFTESLHPRIGGKFASKGGQPVAAARARHAPKTPAPAILPGGTTTRQQQLRYQASQDRQLAHQIMIKVAALVRARDAAIAGIGQGKSAGVTKAPVNAAKSAAAKKAAAARKAGTGKAKLAGKKTAAKARPKTRVQRLNSQITRLRNDARLLIKAADKLDHQAMQT